jgi:hypothetical protein
MTSKYMFVMMFSKEPNQCVILKASVAYRYVNLNGASKATNNEDLSGTASSAKLSTAIVSNSDA